MTTGRDDPSGAPCAADRPAAGASVGNGRYRLVTPQGGRPHLQFWHGIDMALRRDVALTLVDPDGELPQESVHEILARTVRLKGIDMPGIARVHQVLHTGRFGVVVADWIHGGGLHEIAETAPSPAGVAGAMQWLAAGMEAAHRAGLLLSIDDPSRVRISTEGRATLAFPATMPEADVASDLRGLGSAMCLLLEVDDRRVAARDHEIPFLISTTISGLRSGDGGIASAATALTLLREATANDAVTDIDVEGVRVMPPLPPPAPGRYAGFRDVDVDDQSAAARRQIMRLGLVTAAVITVVALVALGSTLNRVLGNDHGAAVLNADKLGLSTPASSATRPQVLQKAAAPAEPVRPAAASVFSPDGSPDSPESAGAAIDGDPATAWSTDTYFDADPFPKFKPGVGLLLQLARPAALSAVTVDLNSTGTVIQLRTAATNTPATLADTTELTPPTPMQPGRNRIPVANAAPVSNVLVWICALGSSDGQHRASISEIGLQAASPPA